MAQKQILVRRGVPCIALAAWLIVHGAAAAQGTSTGRSMSSSSGSSGSSASSVGGGFTGGGTSAGGGYTGGSGSSGSSSTSGGFTGGTGFSSPTGGFGTSGGTGTPSSANPFLSTYVNPLTVGMVDVTGKQTINKAFGQAMYNVVSTATNAATINTANTQNLVYGFNTFGMSRTPYYAATLGDDLPMVVHSSSQLQSTVGSSLQRSSYIQQPGTIKVRVDNGAVILDGTVATAKEKRIAEGLARLTPGVREVVNNLEVPETLPTPQKKTPALGP
jgi:hypothetical protein